MRNIIINSEQEKLLAEAVQEDYTLQKISNKVKHDIETDNTPISNLPISKKLNKKIVTKLVTDGFLDAKNNFTDDITSFPIEKVVNKLDKLTAICKKKEEKIHNELEKLCVDIATSYFNDDKLSDITLECRLVNDLSKDDFHLEPNVESDFESDGNEDKINGRKIANALVMGGALSLYDKLQDKFIPELFKLDEDLPHLYSKIMKINEFLSFVSDDEITDEDNKQSACVKVVLNGEEGNKIIAVGTLFPFLLVETLRGYLEFLSDMMLPENESEADSITDVSDVLIDEPWHMMIGKGLWKRFIGDNDDELTIVNELFSLKEDEFNNICNNVIIGTDEAQSMLDNLVRDARYKHDYSQFEKDLEIKRREYDLLVDNSEETLIDEANYPETFSMNEFKQITSFAGRVKYCKARLKQLGTGSSRMVFKIDDNTVLKLAFNQKGIAQNEADARSKNDYYMKQLDIFPEVYDVDDNYLWIEMQLAKKAFKKDFKRLSGYDFDTIYYWIQYCANNTVVRPEFVRHIPEEYLMRFKSRNFDYEYSILGVLEDYIGNYDVRGYGDLQRINNWGVVRDTDGSERLVIVDNGLDNETLDKYYEK